MIDWALLIENPELAKHLKIEVQCDALLALGDKLIKNALERADRQVVNKYEEYLTPEEMAKTLHISLVTLWSWDKKGITIPLRIGNKKLYRRSDLEKILNNR